MKDISKVQKRKSMIRNVISCILSFVLSVCMVLITVVFVMLFNVLGERVLCNNLNSSGYHTFAYNELMSNIKSATIPTGFPESIYEGVITETDIYNDIIGSIMAQFRKINYTTRASDIKKKLNENINTYFSEIEYTASSEEKELTNAYVVSIAQAYDKCINIPLSSYIINADNVLKKILIAVSAAMLLAIIIIVCIIFRLYKNIYHLLRYLSYALTGSAIMLIALPAWVILGKLHYRLNLSPESFYNLFTRYIDSTLKAILCFGIVWLVLGIAFALPGISKKK